MRKTVGCLTFLFITLLILSAPGFSLVTFDRVLMIPEAVQWYDATTGDFQLSASNGGSSIVTVNAGDLRVYGGGYDYRFNGTVEVTASHTLLIDNDNAILANQSSGVVSTMTVKATDVYQYDSSTGTVGASIISSAVPVTLFVAEMTTTPWAVAETSNDTVYYGVTDYKMISGEFVTGPVARMYDFQAVYELNGSSPSNMGFSENMSSANPQITLKAPVPEPATMVLMGLGGLMLARRKR